MHEVLKEELMGEPAPGYLTEESGLHEAWWLLMNRVFSRTEKAALGTCECGSEGFNCACNFNRKLLSIMGTTAVALVVMETHLVVGNCGDSCTVLYCSACSPCWAMAEVGGWSKMEDAVTVLPHLCSPMINCCVQVHHFTVFDGHGGSHIAQMERLTQHVTPLPLLHFDTSLNSSLHIQMK